VRAVGNANNKNPILIIVPCHRVIGKDGTMKGYGGGGGGVDVKQALLALEGWIPAGITNYSPG
jgi:O-6-methylguanine DNA methyltransferase